MLQTLPEGVYVVEETTANSEPGTFETFIHGPFPSFIDAQEFMDGYPDDEDLQDMYASDTVSLYDAIAEGSIPVTPENSVFINSKNESIEVQIYRIPGYLD